MWINREKVRGSPKPLRFTLWGPPTPVYTNLWQLDLGRLFSSSWQILWSSINHQTEWKHLWTAIFRSFLSGSMGFLSGLFLATQGKSDTFPKATSALYWQYDLGHCWAEKLTLNLLQSAHNLKMGLKVDYSTIEAWLTESCWDGFLSVRFSHLCSGLLMIC